MDESLLTITHERREIVNSNKVNLISSFFLLSCIKTLHVSKSMSLILETTTKRLNVLKKNKNKKKKEREKTLLNPFFPLPLSKHFFDTTYLISFFFQSKFCKYVNRKTFLDRNPDSLTLKFWDKTKNIQHINHYRRSSVSVLLYGCSTWTKCPEKKLKSNYIRTLHAVFNKYWKQHPTKQQLYSHLPLISQIILKSWTKHGGYCWGSKDKLTNNIFPWTPTHVHMYWMLNFYSGTLRHQWEFHSLKYLSVKMKNKYDQFLTKEQENVIGGILDSWIS